MPQDRRELPVRPRRSVLYVPGSRGRALEKATQLSADALIFDLEDSVLPEMKLEARNRVLEALQTHAYRQKEKIVRVNGLQSPWGGADVESMAQVAGVDALLLPKVEHPEEVQAVASMLTELNAPSVQLMAMIETPMGVLQVAAIARSSPRLSALILGTNDLEAQTGAKRTADRLPMLMALSQCIMAARAYRLGVIDGVYTQLDDPTGYAQSCRQGAELGFDGKTVIHPSQIEEANAAFGPSPEAVAQAKRVVAAFEKARAEDQGVAVLDGQMIESLHVEMAERTLAMDRAITAETV